MTRGRLRGCCGAVTVDRFDSSENLRVPDRGRRRNRYRYGECSNFRIDTDPIGQQDGKRSADCNACALGRVRGREGDPAATMPAVATGVLR